MGKQEKEQSAGASGQGQEMESDPGFDRSTTRGQTQEERTGISPEALGQIMAPPPEPTGSGPLGLATPRELANHLGIAESNVRKLARAGVFKRHLLGGTNWFSLPQCNTALRIELGFEDAPEKPEPRPAILAPSDLDKLEEMWHAGFETIGVADVSARSLLNRVTIALMEYHKRLP